MSCYGEYAGKECGGAVLHGLYDMGVPLRVVEDVKIGESSVAYRGKPFATFKWFSLDATNPEYRTALFRFNKDHPDVNERFIHAKLFMDGSVEPKLSLGADDRPTVVIPCISAKIADFVDTYFDAESKTKPLMVAAGVLFFLGEDSISFSLEQEEHSKPLLDHVKTHLRWK